MVTFVRQPRFSFPRIGFGGGLQRPSLTVSPVSGISGRLGGFISPSLFLSRGGFRGGGLRFTGLVPSFGFTYTFPLIRSKLWKRNFRNPLFAAGALVMRIARNSIRHVGYRTRTGRIPKPSRPGTPPRSRHPQKRMKWIYFDVTGMSVYIGPQGLGDPNPITETHEYGGTRRVKRSPAFRPSRRRAVSDAQRVNARRLFLAGRIGGKYRKPPSATVLARYPARPYMRPALQKAQPKLAKLWSNII